VRRSSSKSKPRSGQSSISNFFRASGNEKQSSIEKSSKSKPSKSKSGSQTPSQTPTQPEEVIPTSSIEEPNLEADLELARRLAEEDALEGSQAPVNLEHRKSWSKLFVKHEPPKCDVHGEPCKELVVTKPGPNKGKHFWICSRPLGPGYDAGKARRLREDVDPQYKCDFFKWASDARKSAIRGNS